MAWFPDESCLEDPDDLRDEDVGDFCEAVERGDEQVRFDKGQDDAHDEQGILDWVTSTVLAYQCCEAGVHCPWLALGQTALEKRNGPLGKTLYPARDDPP